MFLVRGYENTASLKHVENGFSHPDSSLSRDNIKHFLSLFVTVRIRLAGRVNDGEAEPYFIRAHGPGCSQMLDRSGKRGFESISGDIMFVDMQSGFHHLNPLFI